MLVEGSPSALKETLIKFDEVGTLILDYHAHLIQGKPKRCLSIIPLNGELFMEEAPLRLSCGARHNRDGLFLL
jgi:hypothetical protein